MFSSLRYITVVIFSFLVILTLLAGVYLKHSYVENIIKNSLEDQSTFITNTFTKNLWNKFYPAIASLYDIKRSDWALYPQFMIFKDEADNLFSGNRDILKIKLYTPNLELFYDSEPTIDVSSKDNQIAFFESTFDDKAFVEDAFKGAKSITIIYNTQINDGKTVVKKAVLKSYVPIRVTDEISGTEEYAKKAIAVMEINYDINSSVRKLETLQFTIVFIVIVALAILTAAIFLASQKAEGLLERQQEASLEMAAAKASAEAESKSKSMFLANVSHELRTPLNAIIGFSEIINSESMGPVGNAQYKEFIKDINTSGVHLLSLINDILDFSKAEENKLNVDFEQVDIRKLGEMCLRMVTPRAEEAKLTLIDALPKERLCLIADNKRLKQAILNLLSNAVKFTPEGGTVTIRAYKDNDQNTVLIEITDTGVGMATQDIAKALSPFGQVDNKLSRRYEGTGLGLPLTKKLVEIMKGKFDIRSELGMGTTVTLTFAHADQLELKL